MWGLWTQLGIYILQNLTLVKNGGTSNIKPSEDFRVLFLTKALPSPVTKGWLSLSGQTECFIFISS